MGLDRNDWWQFFFPRKWECSSQSVPMIARQQLFPTQVGVFLLYNLLGFLPETFSHASGNVSALGGLWRCTNQCLTVRVIQAP